MSKNKTEEYTIALISAVSEVFNEENDHHINQEDLSNEDNLTDFFHALANVMPTYFHNQLTGSESHAIEFNHIANSLIYQNKNK
jgi:hypothetical protein